MSGNENKKKGGFFRTLFRGINILRLFIINIIFFLFFFSFLGILGSVQTDKQKPAKVTDDSVLYINPCGLIIETKDDIFSGTVPGLNNISVVLLSDITKAIKNAAFDRRISSLYLDFSGLEGLSSGHLNELSQVLEEFKASGKKIYAYSVQYTIPSYFAASYADKIGIDPLGDISFAGFASRPIFYKGMEEKFGIKWNVLQAGDFKGLAETYSRDSLSQNVRSNLKTMFDRLWNKYTEDIAKNRNISVPKIQDFALNNNEYIKKYQGNIAEAALNEGLVTDIASEEVFCEKCGLSKTAANFVDYKGYNANFSESFMGSNVAVINLKGAITSAPLKSSGASGEILDLFDIALEDPSVKAIVLRIDSGGGEVFASEEIRRAVIRAKDSVPVVVSMGTVAASGAYWISSAADYIFASPYTITGSIGVLGTMPTFQNALKKHLGITGDLVYSGQKPAYSVLEDPSEEDKEIRRLEILNIYKTFIETVAQGRDLPFETVAEMAGGKVYSGEQALKLKLIDSLGTLNDAASYAARLADIDGNFSIKEIKKPLTLKEEFIKSLFSNADFSVLSQLNFADLKATSEFLLLNSKKGIYIYTPERLIWQK